MFHSDPNRYQIDWIKSTAFLRRFADAPLGPSAEWKGVIVYPTHGSAALHRGLTHAAPMALVFCGAGTFVYLMRAVLRCQFSVLGKKQELNHKGHDGTQGQKLEAVASGQLPVDPSTSLRISPFDRLRAGSAGSNDRKTAQVASEKQNLDPSTAPEAGSGRDDKPENSTRYSVLSEEQKQKANHKGHEGRRGQKQHLDPSTSPEAGFGRDDKEQYPVLGTQYSEKPFNHKGHKGHKGKTKVHHRDTKTQRKTGPSRECLSTAWKPDTSSGSFTSHSLLRRSCSFRMTGLKVISVDPPLSAAKQIWNWVLGAA